MVVVLVVPCFLALRVWWSRFFALPFVCRAVAVVSESRFCHGGEDGVMRVKIELKQATWFDDLRGPT